MESSWEQSQRPPWRKLWCIFCLRQEAILYRIDSVSFSLPAFCILDFHLLLLFTIIYLAILINKWILAGIDWHSKVIWDSGSLMNTLCPIFTLNEDSQIPSYHELHELSSALLGEAWKEFGSQIKVEFVCSLHWRKLSLSRQQILC